MTRLSDHKRSLSLGHLFFLSYLVLGILGFSYLHWAERQSQVKIPVLKRDLPAYTQIKPIDLTEQSLPARSLPSETVKELDKVRDRYTVVAISKDKPITQNQLGPELTADQQKWLQNTILVGMPATPAMILGGNLQAGDAVNITIVPVVTESQLNPPSIQFDNTFVFDIKLNSTNSSANQSPESVVVLAIPADRQAEFSRNLVGSRVMLSRRF